MTAPSRLLREIVILVAVVLALGLGAFAAQKFLFSRPPAAPDLGRSLDDALGPVVLREVELSQDVLHDRTADAAFDAIMARLGPAFAALAPDAPRVRILVIDSPAINAFALPGGTICVYTGLMRALTSADQMAAILGHELSHVAHRDPLALLARQLGVAALTSVLTGGRAGDLARTIAQTLVNVRYGRQAEDRADRFSEQLLGRASLDPSAFTQALERIRKAEPGDPKLLVWIDTHSPIEERIRRAAEEARTLSVTPRRLDVSWPKVIRSLPGHGE